MSGDGDQRLGYEALIWINMIAVGGELLFAPLALHSYGLAAAKRQR
jgi:hypothetical protein